MCGSSSPTAGQLHHQVVEVQVRILAIGTFTLSTYAKVYFLNQAEVRSLSLIRILKLLLKPELLFLEF